VRRQIRTTGCGWCASSFVDLGARLCVANDARWELAVTGNPGATVADFLFDGSGRLLLAERGPQLSPNDYGAFTAPGVARVLNYGPLATIDAGTPGRALAEHGFVPLSGGSATAAINGAACELDVIATKNCSGRAATWTELPAAGEAIWLPSNGVPSDHVPLIAHVNPPPLVTRR